VDRKGRTVLGLFVPVTNPGGPTNDWLWDMFIAHRPNFEMFPALRPEYDDSGVQTGGYREENWVFVDALLEGNPYMRDDYKQTQLATLGETRYKQLAEGNWLAFSGQFFPEWNERYHVRHAVMAAA
jgi:hypothetical protein